MESERHFLRTVNLLEEWPESKNLATSKQGILLGKEGVSEKTPNTSRSMRNCPSPQTDAWARHERQYLWSTALFHPYLHNFCFKASANAELKDIMITSGTSSPPQFQQAAFQSSCEIRELSELEGWKCEVCWNEVEASFAVGDPFHHEDSASHSFPIVFAFTAVRLGVPY